MKERTAKPEGGPAKAWGYSSRCLRFDFLDLPEGKLASMTVREEKAANKGEPAPGPARPLLCLGSRLTLPAKSRSLPRVGIGRAMLRDRTWLPEVWT